jgi:polysaccharide export outer membrane protein
VTRLGTVKWAWIVALCATFCISRQAAAAAPDHIYTLAPGDRIAVAVIGQADLSAELMIDNAGDISLPLIGTMAVGGLTASACQELIRSKLAGGFLNNPTVSVRISELRPLYIIGDVRSPGSYPFRFGITAKSALALAGGFATIQQVPGTGVPDLLAADERVRRMVLERQTMLIRRARLQAERDGRNSFVPPPATEVDGKTTAALVTMETATLASHLAMHTNQLDLLKAQQPRLMQEIAATKSQIVAGGNQLNFIKGEVERSSDLVRKGLGVRASEVQLKLEQVTQEGELWKLTAYVARLQIEIGELDIRIQEADSTFRKKLEEDLQGVQSRLAELDATLPVAREIREVRLQQVSNVTGETARAISITRLQQGGFAVLEASENMILNPGDVVEVQLIGATDTLHRLMSQRDVVHSSVELRLPGPTTTQ